MARLCGNYSSCADTCTVNNVIIQDEPNRGIHHYWFLLGLESQAKSQSFRRIDLVGCLGGE